MNDKQFLCFLVYGFAIFLLSSGVPLKKNKGDSELQYHIIDLKSTFKKTDPINEPKDEERECCSCTIEDVGYGPEVTIPYIITSFVVIALNILSIDRMVHTVWKVHPNCRRHNRIVLTSLVVTIIVTFYIIFQMMLRITMVEPV